MDPNLKKVIDSAKDGMVKSIEHFEHELSKVRAGKASPQMLDGIRVDYYGTPTPLNQVGAVSTSDARTLVISPYEKKMIAPIERAIVEANLGLNPGNDGVVIRIVIPPLSEDRRKQLAKQAKEAAEDARVAIRNVRRDHNEQAKKLQKSGVPEDEIKASETEIQKLTDNHVKKVDEIFAAKEKEIMTV
jgi:ribosome recycling factor